MPCRLEPRDHGKAEEVPCLTRRHLRMRLNPPNGAIPIAKNVCVAVHGSTELPPWSRRIDDLVEVIDKRRPRVRQAVEERVATGALDLGPADLRRIGSSDVLRSGQSVDEHLVTEAGAEKRKPTVDNLADQRDLCIEPGHRLEDRRLGASQDHVRESPERRNGSAGGEVAEVGRCRLQVGPPMPGWVEEDSVHRIVDDQDARPLGHGSSIAGRTSEGTGEIREDIMPGESSWIMKTKAANLSACPGGSVAHWRANGSILNG